MSYNKNSVKHAYTNRNKVQLVHGGKPYFSLLNELINKAKKSIHIQVYIYNHDTTGNEIAEALVKAAERGVKVYFMVDGYASQRLPKLLQKQFSDAGVYFDEFEPLFRSRTFYFGRRMHHKVVVVDGFTSLVGGLNLADRYNDVDNIPAWLDYAVCIEGEASFELNKLCCEMWNRNSVKCKVKPDEKAETKADAIPVDERCSVRIRRNDWVRRKNSISKSYFEMFNHASDSIIIMCSYFLPGWVYRNRMEKAVKRGVRIRVVAAGKSDILVAKYAERYLYKWMLKNKIELYEYERNVLHAKVAVQDSKWMTIGSYNVNNISAHASIELNVDIRNRPFVSEVEEELEKVIKEDCVRITEEVYIKGTNFFIGFLRRAAYEFIRLVLYLFTFYFKKEE